MIFWKEYNLRFACSSCIKGHRSAKCSHLKRKLQEVKQKGRPASQCPSCRTKREMGQGHSHHKCKCGNNPPLSTIKKHNVIFEDGLELQFDPPSSFNIAIFQVRMNQKTPVELTVIMDKKEEEIERILPKEFKITEEQVSVKPSPNACQCHFGGNCICSSLPQERKKKSKPNSNPKPTGGCSCSSGCCSGGANSCGSSCGCASGGSCGQSNSQLLQQQPVPVPQNSNSAKTAGSCCGPQVAEVQPVIVATKSGSCCSGNENSSSHIESYHSSTIDPSVAESLTSSQSQLPI